MKQAASPEKDRNRLARLLRIIKAIREDPRQSVRDVWEPMGISRSQFYKDREALEGLGFKFEHDRVHGFTILEDRLSPLADLTLSDRVILMLAIQSLSACGEGSLTAMALAVARKLANGLGSPFREQLSECFDREITSKSFGVDPQVWEGLQEAVAKGRYLKILYMSAHGGWKTRWREVYPRRLYFAQRTLYLYALDQDADPNEWKTFRLSRIKALKPTGVSRPWRADQDDGFRERQRNAFISILGKEAHKVRIRFRGEAAKYVAEQKWHESQELERDGWGELILTVTDDGIVLNTSGYRDSNLEYFQVSSPGDDIPWLDRRATEFRKAFLKLRGVSPLPGQLHVASPEHTMESALLTALDGGGPGEAESEGVRRRARRERPRGRPC